MAKFNLSEAAKDILNANVASKKSGQQSGVGDTKLPSSVAYDTKDAGEIGQSPEKKDDSLPNYTSGTPTATPPGATPPVGAQSDGVGASKPAGQPQETQGRSDLTSVSQSDATDYASIRDRIAGKLAPQQFKANPGATFQSYGEDMDVMFSGEELSEDFKQKAATIFEAAVISRSEQIVEAIEIELVEQFQEAVEEIKEDLASKVDDYISYFVEEWVKENEIAIEKGLRAEIVEDFISALRNVFVEHYIDIPEDKVDVVESLTTKVEELEDQLNEAIKVSIELNKELKEQQKIEAIHTVCEGLTQTQVEKLKSLAEGVEFTTEAEFAEKLNVIKESYFKEQVKSADASALDDEVHIEEETKKVSGSVDPLMEQYAKTISQTLKV